MHIGDIIKTLRKEQGVTQDDLAAALNISPQSVSKWENGAANPDILYIPLIAKYFKVSVESLFCWDNQDYSTEYLNNMDFQKQLLMEDSIDSVIELWEDMHLKYPNDYRILKQLIAAMCSKNDKNMFHKIFKYAITALRGNQNNAVENEILESLKQFMISESTQTYSKKSADKEPPKEESLNLNCPDTPLKQHEINVLFTGMQNKRVSGKRVLIADDSVLMRKILTDILTMGGYEIVGEAANGIEAVKAYREFLPDIVTMNITMPELDGICATEQIMETDPKACVVICSAMSYYSIVLDAIRLGVCGFVAKPFLSDTLLDVMRSLSFSA